MTFATGCFNRVIKETEVVERKPPAVLLEDCPIPDEKPRLWGDTLPIIDGLKKALEECNEDKKALREILGE